MYEYPDANNVERVEQIFEELRASGEPNIEGKYIKSIMKTYINIY
jgi:hypothetical protein